MSNTERTMLFEQSNGVNNKHKTKEMSYSKVITAILIGIVINVVGSIIIVSWSTNRVLPSDVEKKADKTELKQVESSLNIKIDTKVDKVDLDKFLEIYDKKNMTFLEKLDKRIERMENISMKSNMSFAK